MRWLRSSTPFGLLMVIGILVFSASIWGVVSGNDWMIYVIGAYGLLLFLGVVFSIILSKRPIPTMDSIEEFEKTLKGGLYHFKCPHCKGIFALKKSRRNDKKPLKMTCPDCGEIATISPNPIYIWDEIPEKKSLKVNFRCKTCGEGLTVWAEGADLYQDVCICSCPYCGEQKALSRV